MSRPLSGFVAALAVMAASSPLIAHHSFVAQYDATKQISLTGTVTRLEWMNPHVYFYLDVKDETGKVTNWAIEASAPNQLYRSGWRKDSLKAGDVVTVVGALARDGSKLANMRSAVLPDGRRVFERQPEGAASIPPSGGRTGAAGN